MCLLRFAIPDWVLHSNQINNQRVIVIATLQHSYVLCNLAQRIQGCPSDPLQIQILDGMAPLPAIGNVALATLPYNGCIEQGFIGIHTGDAIKILYAGQSEGETEWIYAEKCQPPNQVGWLPIACVIRLRKVRFAEES